jgi:hypothetical protein
MNSVVTYHDSNTAWLTSDGVLSWVTSTVYERFAGGSYMSGIKLVRGYSDLAKAKEGPQTAPTNEHLKTAIDDERDQKRLKRRSAPAATYSIDTVTPQTEPTVPSTAETGLRLQRQLSSLMEGTEKKDPAAREEEIRKRQEKEIQDDYNGQAGETQGRSIEHLILVTHGIGQLLSLR